MLRLASVALLLAGLASCSGQRSSGDEPSVPERKAATAPAAPEPVLGAERPAQRERHPAPPRLSQAQLAGQHVVFAFDGTVAPPELLARIRRAEAAGVILFRRNIATWRQLAALTRSLHRAARRSRVRARLLVMVDEEGGQITRVPGLGIPGAAQLGARRDPTAAYRAGRSTGRAMRRLGITVNLAPVADVGARHSVLERYERTYARDPELVAELASGFAAGLANEGVAATAKHFPGFGAARTSTDQAAVVIRRSQAALRSNDMAPFAALVDEGVPLVMMSTARYPALAPRPAAFSREIATRWLRDLLGFEGVVVTDDLETPATQPLGPPEVLAPAAVAAGNDLVMFAKTYAAGDRAARGLDAALAGGRLSRQAMLHSARRVIALRRRVGRRRGGG